MQINIILHIVYLSPIVSYTVQQNSLCKENKKVDFGACYIRNSTPARTQAQRAHLNTVRRLLALESGSYRTHAPTWLRGQSLTSEEEEGAPPVGGEGCVWTTTSWQCWICSRAGSLFCLMSAFSARTMLTMAFSSSFTSPGLQQHTHIFHTRVYMQSIK